MVIVESKLGDVAQAALSRFANRARKAVGLAVDVNVLITTSEALRELNRRFRGKDKETDVLSFPSALEGFGGDIAISADIAKENGERLGHGTATELKILILHGMLHLAGYDHESDNGRMERKERQLRTELGLPEGLIERNLQSAGRGKRITSTKSGKVKSASSSNAAVRARRRKR